VRCPVATKRIITNDGQLEMVDDESPNVGLDEIVGERMADLFSTRTWQRIEIADKTDEPQTKMVRSRCGLPYGYGK
jgi:hypothetical protein